MKQLLTILLSLLATVTYALPIECVGTATQVINGDDTTFIFRDEIHMRCTSGEVDWYYDDGTLYMSNATDIYPGEGCYRVGSQRFCVQLYEGIDDLDFTVETSCTSTLVRVTGDISSRAHTYSLSYNALAWDGEAWVDSANQVTGTSLPSSIYLPPLYDSTYITLCYDMEIRTALEMAPACVELEVPIEDIKAVNFQLTSLATTRGQENEKSNERNRPKSQKLVVGTEYSGAMEVAFYSNPTPAVRFYRWDIYQSSDRLVTRYDQDIRFTFVDHGKYRVVCSVNNGTCAADSMEMEVAIAESYLAVPNVFTPNGDGMNDEFRVSYRSLKEFHIWVYNRWGKLVYESTDPAKGWDGTINGRPAAEGAYFYVVRALGTDAAKDAGYMSKISYTKKKLSDGDTALGIYQMSGDINLLRGKR